MARRSVKRALTPLGVVDVTPQGVVLFSQAYRRAIAALAQALAYAI
jgi:hypothetical protein